MHTSEEKRSAESMRIVVACALILLPTWTISSAASYTVEAYIPHPPIKIDTNQDFFGPLSGVTGGSGTPADPFVIAGWLLVAKPPLNAPGAAILIQNTDAHVIIRDNLFVDNSGPIAILVKNASNVAISRNVLAQGRLGVVVGDAENIAITGNIIGDANPAVIVKSSANISIQKNTITCYPTGLLAAVELAEVADAEASGNSIICNEGPAMRITDSQHLRIVHNDVTNTTYGFLVETSRDVNVSSNHLWHNRGVAISLQWVDGYLLDGNSVLDQQGPGLSLAKGGPSASQVSNNVIESNSGEKPFVFDDFRVPFHVTFDNNTIAGKPLLAYHGLADKVLSGAGLVASYLLVIEPINVTITAWNISATEWPLTVVGGHNVHITGNSLSGGGLRVVGGAGNIVSGNMIDSKNDRALLAASPGIWIESNNIKTNKSGIVVDHVRDGSGYEWTAEDAVIHGNTILSKGCPVCLLETSNVTVQFNYLDGSLPRIYGSSASLFRFNSITAGGLYVRKTGWPSVDFGSVDATHNWWGTFEGPSAMDTDDTPVFVEPWLREPI